MTDQLPIYLDQIASAKENFSAAEWTSKPSPEKWSRQEIMGHLVDSAMHNLKRFYDIKHQVGDYQVVRYPQNELVQLRKYNSGDWSSIFNSLKFLNLEIHNSVSQMGAEDLVKVVIDPDGGVHTAEWLFRDYVAHFEHHIKQIFGPQFIA